MAFTPEYIRECAIRLGYSNDRVEHAHILALLAERFGLMCRIGQDYEHVAVSCNDIQQMKDSLMAFFGCSDVVSNDVPTTAKHDAFRGFCNKMFDTFVKKNHDYGNAFEYMCDKYGIAYPLIHIEEKFRRIESLGKSKELVENESIEDSLLDMANYCILTLVQLKLKQNEQDQKS